MAIAFFCARFAAELLSATEDLNEPSPCLNAEASSLLFLADGLAALDFAALRAAATAAAEEAEGADRSPVCGRRSPGDVSFASRTVRADRRPKGCDSIVCCNIVCDDVLDSSRLLRSALLNPRPSLEARVAEREMGLSLADALPSSLERRKALADCESAPMLPGRAKALR